MAGGIEIVKAVYGAGNNMVDVTEAVQKQALNIPGVLFSITSGNNLVPKDPAPGKGKTLVLTYKQDGKENTARIFERKSFSIHGVIAPSKELKIVKAVYGVGNKWVDVTAKVAPVIAQGKDIKATNVLFTDPAPGKGKNLIVLYTVNNQVKTTSIPENGTLKAAAFKK